MSKGHAEDHGHTPAAWTAVTIVFLGSLLGAVAVIVANLPLFWISMAVMAGGAVVGKVMSSASKAKRQPA